MIRLVRLPVVQERVHRLTPACTQPRQFGEHGLIELALGNYGICSAVDSVGHQKFQLPRFVVATTKAGAIITMGVTATALHPIQRRV